MGAGGRWERVRRRGCVHVLGSSGPCTFHGKFDPSSLNIYLDGYFLDVLLCTRLTAPCILYTMGDNLFSAAKKPATMSARILVQELRP